ncbi:RCC1/BLIP-II [Mycena floridula]|nr:RCC1/BLIP-II [Mycena floridula]
MPAATRPKRTAAVAKPVSKPAKSAKLEASAPPKSTTRKRAASIVERSSSPPPKRTRGEDQNVAPPAVAEKPKSKATVKKAPVSKARSKAVPAPKIQLKPYFNPLPSIPQKTRPGLQLFVWGAGNCGQFGLGPDVLHELEKPKKHTWVEQQIEAGTFGEPGAGLESVAAGGMHTLFIDEKGTIWSCGLNDDAALGRITENVPDPENPGSFLDIDELTSVPRPLQSLVDENFRAVQVVAGDSICAAVSDKGELKVWGSFRVNEGALGFSSAHRHQYLPASILTLSSKAGDYEKVSSVANGANHLLVLTTHGKIYAWGAGEQGQLGRKILERRKIHGTVPEKVTLGTDSRTRAVIVGAGIYHSFAVDDSGVVWGWGLNSMGQTGTGYSDEDAFVPQPAQVIGLSQKELGGKTKVVSIAGGEHHTLFLTSDGKVYACGRSNAGQLGLADDDEAFADREHPDFLAEPVQVKFPDEDDKVVRIAVGLHNNMAVMESGALYCWGQGTQSELGVPDVEVKTPRMIVRREGGLWSAVEVACGGQHTLGLFRKK